MSVETLSAPVAETRRVVPIDPVSDPRWRAFVRGREDATIYHDGSWFEVLQRTYRYRPASLACLAGDGSVLGVLPMVEKPSLLGRRHLSSLPHTPLAGPLATDRLTLAELARAAVRQVEDSSCRWLQLKVSSTELTGLVDGLVGTEGDPTFLLTLADRPEDLKIGGGKNRARAKWAAKAAARRGVEVRVADSRADLAAWYPLYLDTMRAISIPPHPFRLFEAMWDVLRPQGIFEMLLAEIGTGGGRTLLAGSMFLTFGRTVSYVYTGRRPDSLSLHPNDALQWHAINKACSDGMHLYDFGESARWNRGLIEFKMKWGAQPFPLYRYHYPRPHEVEHGALEHRRAVRGWGDRAWRRIPLRLTVPLGTAAYRWL